MADSTMMQPIQQKSNSNCLLYACLGFLLAICCCCFLFIGFIALTFGVGLSKFASYSNVFNKFCDSTEADLRDLYNTRFTPDYRARVSFQEFDNLYNNNKDIFDCGKTLNSVGYTDIINGLNVSVNNNGNQEVVDLQFVKKSKKITIRLIINPNNEPLIDQLDITKV